MLVMIARDQGTVMRSSSCTMRRLSSTKLTGFRDATLNRCLTSPLYSLLMPNCLYAHPIIQVGKVNVRLHMHALCSMACTAQMLMQCWEQPVAAVHRACYWYCISLVAATVETAKIMQWHYFIK